MKVKDLKTLLDRLPEDTEVLASDGYGWRPCTAYESIGVQTRVNPPYHHKFVAPPKPVSAKVVATPDACVECGYSEKAHETPKGLMADSDHRQFILVSKDTCTPRHLIDNSEKVLVIET